MKSKEELENRIEALAFMLRTLVMCVRKELSHDDNCLCSMCMYLTVAGADVGLPKKGTKNVPDA